MSPTCTRLVRCRVRDLASCFYACRLPLDEEPDSIVSSRRPQMSNGNTISKSEVLRGAHKAEKRPEKDVGECLVRNLSSNTSKGGRVVEDGNGSEPHFAEEDYIVFCFKEDGEIDMIINNNEGNKASEGYCDQNDEHADIISASTILRPITNNMKKGDVKGSKEKGNERPQEGEINSSEHSNNTGKMESFESCDSNLSDASTSSFAFPALGLDWIGSPVHMPKSETTEARSVCLHCCSF